MRGTGGIALTGPPADPGVSHLHAVVPGVRVPLRDGDRTCVGAWTVLTIRACRPSGQRPVAAARHQSRLPPI